MIIFIYTPYKNTNVINNTTIPAVATIDKKNKISTYPLPVESAGLGLLCSYTALSNK